MAQNIGEGTLDIPQMWTNSSVNIFTAQPPGQVGPSITVNRDRLPRGVDFAEYAGKELRKLGGKLKGFAIVEEREARVDGRPARLYEFTWKGNGERTMHQILVAVNDGGQVLNIVASHQSVMEPALREQMLAVLMSLRFTAPARG